MKIAKLSIAALAVVGFSSSVMALNLDKATIKPYVNTKAYYETIDNGSTDAKLFKRGNSSGDAVVQLGATGALNGCWGYGLEYTIADTLGLENSVVSGVRVGQGESENALDTRDWMSQAYITFRGCGTALDKTTFKIGRQYLDTPLAFTEKWNAAPNSFDAMVVINSDIENVTLVGAVVTGGNGIFGSVANADTFSTYARGADGNATQEGNGAHAVGILTNFGIPVNLWYYNVRSIATAFWADASGSVNGINLGAQYGKMSGKDTLDGIDDTKGGALMIGGSVAGINLMAAYSKMDDKGTLYLGNTATMNAADGTYKGAKKTKLYTAGIYTDGQSVAVPGSKAWKIKASTATPIGKLTAQYVKVENTVNDNANTNQKELDVILGTKVLGINTKLIYMDRKFTETAAATKDSKHVRVILSKNF